MTVSTTSAPKARSSSLLMALSSRMRRFLGALHRKATASTYLLALNPGRLAVGV